MSEGAILAEFSSSFGVPLLLGGECIVAEPLGSAGLRAVRHGLSVDTAMNDAIESLLIESARLVEICPAPFDEDAGTLLFALHELFASCHPQSDSFYARGHLFCQAAEDAVLRLPRTLDVPRLLTRHLIVSRLFSAQRVDAHVSWWSGKASFFGEEVPTRLTYLPGLRNVHVDKKVRPLWKVASVDGDEALRTARLSLMRSLLTLSPLTDLLLLGHEASELLGFSLILPHRVGGKKSSPLALLDEPAIARACTDVLLSTGITKAGASLALAVMQGLREGVSPFWILRALELVAHLVIVAAFAHVQDPTAPETSAFATLFQDDSTLDVNDGLFWALFRAILDVDGELIKLPILDSKTQSLLDKLGQRLEAADVVKVAAPLRREMLRRLSKAARARAA